MINIKKSFKLLNWKLLLAIFLTLFIPTLYRTTRSFFIGTIPGTYNFSIAGNLQWINIFFEVLEEAFLLPLFFTLSNILKNKKSDKRNNLISGQIVSISLIYFVAIIFFVSFTPQLMKMMNANTITSKSIYFVRIEFITRWFIMIGKIGLILLIAKDKYKAIISILFVITICNILMDLFISSNNKFSLNKGVTWIALNQLIINLVAAIFYVVFVSVEYKFKKKHFIPKFYIDKKNILQNVYSGAESFIRNAFFVWFVIKTINKLNNGYDQGDFWVANTFIWSWLLLPILSISQYLNKSQALNGKGIPLKDRMIAPFILICITVLLWIIFIPTYEPFIKNILNNKHSKVINKVVLVSLGFYVLMALNDPIDKTLYGEGKAQYMLFQSLVVNIAIYIPYYYLSSSMTLTSVALMMGSAIALDSLITMVIFVWWVKKNK